jgi:rsbT co-antagonist protein RsbR
MVSPPHRPGGDFLPEADDPTTLRARVAELERALAAAEKARAEAEAHTDRLRDFFNNAPCGYHSLDLEGRYVSVNDTELAWLGYAREEVLGKLRFGDIMAAESAPVFREGFARFLREGWVNDIELTLVRKDGSSFDILLNAVAVKDADGKYLRSRAVLFDTTERRRAEAAHRRAAIQEELLRAQAEALAALSCPLLTVAEGVLVMPLIGAIDARRASLLQASLLDGIAACRARVAILDITGVAAVDRAMAEVLIRTAQAVRLLGAEVVLTGIRPEVAQAFVALGADLGGLITRGTLEAGIAHAMGDPARSGRA